MKSFRLATRLSAGPEPAPPPAPVFASSLASAPMPATGAVQGVVSGAVPVPWRVARRGGIVDVVNTSREPLRAVRFSLAGAGLLGLSLPRTVHPGERLRVVLRGTRQDAAVHATDALLVLRWFQPDGKELLWPIVP